MVGGRQREFDKAYALEKAMLTFWKNGYAGTSLSDLTEAMGINKPSMYAAFGNKEQLFVQSLDFYINHTVLPSLSHLTDESKPLRDRLNGYVARVIEGLYIHENVSGCFVSMSTADWSSTNLPPLAHHKVSEVKDFAYHHLVDFFKREKVEGKLAEHSKPEDLANTLMVFFHGSALLARSGKSSDQLKAVFDNIMASIPIID